MNKENVKIKNVNRRRLPKQTFLFRALREKKGFAQVKGGGNNGFTLIEVVIYIAIFSMIAVTLVSLAYASAREDRETINNVLQAYEDI
jgi:prepilin-type N-terminal cleavage/methylation domain-containing protein